MDLEHFETSCEVSQASVKLTVAKSILQVESTGLRPDHRAKTSPVKPQFKEENSTEKERLRLGIAYQHLTVNKIVLQNNPMSVANYALSIVEHICRVFGRSQKVQINLIKSCEGLLLGSEMVLVLGKPDSGCDTYLRALAFQSRDLLIDPRSELNYHGIPRGKMSTEFRGECNLQADTDFHFPTLTVAQTLKLAVASRLQTDPGSTGREKSTDEILDSTTAALGLSHTLDTIVGNDTIKGLSGGERHRVSVGEALVCHASIQCWENLTKGLDSSTALSLVKVLQKTAKISGVLHLTTINQASQDIYDLFDKVVLFYGGRQVYFGDAKSAEEYFRNLGFDRPRRCTTSDFLTSITNPAERSRVVSGSAECKAPRTADDFYAAWLRSPERVALMENISLYNARFPVNEKGIERVREIQKNLHRNSRSPYKIGILSQIHLCIIRGFQRLANDLAPPLSALFGNAIVSIILGSVFFDMPADTSSFFSRGALIFFTIMTNTFLGAFEANQLWEQRPIVQKHFYKAMYRPCAEAIASMICDIPNNIILTTSFNLPVYFLSNMRRTPQAFLTFYAFAFATLVAGSMLFRLIAICSRTLSSSVAPGANFVLLLVAYTGFVIPIQDMHSWLRWFAYIDPVGYAFESLMINEFSGQKFPCRSFVPQGTAYTETPHMCTVPGSTLGSDEVDGYAYLQTKFHFNRDHLWSNFGVIISLVVLFCGLYLLATEYLSPRWSPSKGSHGSHSGISYTKDSFAEHETSKNFEHSSKGDITESPGLFSNSDTILVWNKLCYDIKVKKGRKRILHDIEGYIKPGTLTALMGASGAGKTTLLNILASRATVGVITGEIIVDPKHQNESFARKVGYAQQQDIHLPTTTVREAMIFSARLRQPTSYSDTEKLDWVDQLIYTLDLSSISDEMIGLPNSGLSAEQRKRVTIGVELAARPELLLFLDEPTSGLDSNTARCILNLLKKLVSQGQHILCTIHQPSGTLFEMFDSLLLLQHGRSVYFGELGPGAQIVIDYFQRSGARICNENENPAEWLLEVVHNSTIPWSDLWSTCRERSVIQDEIKHIKAQHLIRPQISTVDRKNKSEFASVFWYQLSAVTKRTMELDWRTPSYIYSKILMTVGAGLINGFSFYRSPNSLQGMQNQIFSVFLLLTLHSNAVQLLMPHFIDSRTLFEIRERPSRTYSWTVFVLSNIIAELPWQAFLSVLLFICWYYPLGLFENALATNQLTERSVLIFSILWAYLTFSSTFAQMLGTFMPDAATGVNISALLYTLALINCGVLVPPSSLPKLWNFIYQITPVNYFANSLLSTGISGVPVECAKSEILVFDPEEGKTCGTYLQEYMKLAGGSILNPKDIVQCQVCPLADTTSLLASIGVDFDQRWRNFGITLAFCAINILAALFFYWLARVPKKSKIQGTEKGDESPQATSLT